MKEEDNFFEIELVVESCLPHEFSDFYHVHTTEAERETAGPIEVRHVEDHVQLSDGKSEIANLLLVLGSSGALAILGKVVCVWIKSNRVLFAMRDRLTGKEIRIEGKGKKVEKAIRAFLDNVTSRPPSGAK